MSSLASRADEWIRRNGDQMVGNLADAVYALETSALVRDLASALRDADGRIAGLLAARCQDLETALRECLGTDDENPGLYLLGCEAANVFLDDAETDKLIAQADGIEARARIVLEPTP